MSQRFGIAKRIGFFGGSFNPAHFGHLGISNIALQKLKLNKVFWLVVPCNPFKVDNNLPLSSRLELCKTLIGNNKKMEAIDFESNLPSFETIETVRKIKRTFHAAKLFWIMGADSLLSFHKWRGCDFIAKNLQMVVLTRGNMHKAVRSPAFIKFKPHIIWHKNFSISSTKIREGLGKNWQVKVLQGKVVS